MSWRVSSGGQDRLRRQLILLPLPEPCPRRRLIFRTPATGKLGCRDLLRLPVGGACSSRFGASSSVTRPCACSAGAAQLSTHCRTSCSWPGADATLLPQNAQARGGMLNVVRGVCVCCRLVSCSRSPEENGSATRSRQRFGCRGLRVPTFMDLRFLRMTKARDGWAVIRPWAVPGHRLGVQPYPRHARRNGCPLANLGKRRMEAYINKLRRSRIEDESYGRRREVMMKMAG